MKKIFTYQFRNLFPGEVCFSPGVNIICGGNGQGKTNLLEAIFLLGRGKSFRANREEELIQWEKEGYFIRGMLSFRDGERLLAIKSLAGKKEALLDNKPASSLSQLGELFTLVIFVPEDLQLVKGAPSHRRRFLDEEISQIQTGYRESVNRYQKVLRERNNLLKREKWDEDLGAVLDEQLLTYGSAIVEKRIEVIEKLNPLARLMNRRLSERKEDLLLRYRSILRIDRISSLESIKRKMHQCMEEKRREEALRRTTLIGPHLDDLEILVNGKNLREFGSQGQQRTTALALKLAQIELFRAEKGEYPVLLLDDVFSELDNHRCMEVGKILQKKVQSFITTTSLQGLQGIRERNHIMRVDRGNIIKEE